MNNSIEILFRLAFFLKIYTEERSVISASLQHSDCLKGRTIKRETQGEMKQTHNQCEGLQWLTNDPELSACVIKIFCVSDETVAPRYCRFGGLVLQKCHASRAAVEARDFYRLRDMY